MSYKGCYKNEWGGYTPYETGISDATKGWILAILILVGFPLLCIIGYNTISKSICKVNAEKMGFEYDYTLFTGCKIKLENEHLIDIQKYHGGSLE